MSDAVQEIMEDMVPELEDLARKRIFSQPEIKEIVRKRREFEYKLKRRESDKTEYLRYICYESALDKLRGKRKKRLGFGKKSKSSVSDFSMQKRLHFIFDRMLRKWKGDCVLWNQYIDFCIEQRATKILSAVFARALQYHPRDVPLWIRASTWHFDDVGDIKAARVMCQRGLRMADGSVELWAHYMRLELCYIDKLRQRQKLLGIENAGVGSAAPDKLASATVRIVTAIVNNAKSAIPGNHELLLKLANVCVGFPDTQAVEEGLLLELTTEFPSAVEGWVALAQRKLNRVLAQQKAGRSVSHSAIVAAREAAFGVLDDCAKEHSQAVGLWEAYCQLAREKAADNTENGGSRVATASQLLLVYSRAVAALGGQCPEDLSSRYCADLSLLGRCSEAATVAQQGCERLVGSGVPVGRLAHMLLCLAIKDAIADKSEEALSSSVEAVFQQCFGWVCAREAAIGTDRKEDQEEATKVDGSKLALWQSLLEYMILSGASVVDVAARCGDAVSSCGPGSAKMTLRACQLHWQWRLQGMAGAREYYAKILRDGDGTLAGDTPSFLRACLDLELGQPASDRDAIRRLFEQATAHETIKTGSEIWLEWMAIEQGWGEWGKASALHFRAMHTVANPDGFMRMHSLWHSIGGASTVVG